MIFPENRFPFFRIMLQAMKKPRTFSGGASDQMMRAVQLRAHVSRSPGGLCGFGGGFAVRRHGAGLCGSF
jgi:hypothetical protein